MNLLTGKCLEKFKEYLEDKLHDVVEIESEYGDYYNIKVYVSEIFDKSPLSMKYGIYVDFFESVDLDVMIGKYGYSVKYLSETISIKNRDRTKNRIESIKKANELYNNNN